MKRFKIVLAAVLYHTGLLFLLNKVLGRKNAVILSFHRIVANPSQAGSTPTLPYLTTVNFEKLIKYLKDNYRLLSLNDWVSGSKDTGAVILTFDDGWEDNYAYAYPILKKYKVPATIFLAVNFIGTKKLFWQVKLFQLLRNLDPEKVQCLDDPVVRKKIQAVLKKGVKLESYRQLAAFLKTKTHQEIQAWLDSLDSQEEANQATSLSWEEVREMLAAGLDFGSHSLNHLILIVEAEETVREELQLSKKILEEKLKTKVNHFAYPSGEYDQNVKAMLKEAGYLSAASIREDVNTRQTDLYQLNRIEIEENKVTDTRGGFSGKLYELETCWLYLKIRNWLKKKQAYS